jgi:carboxymethylenebutenolidase
MNAELAGDLDQTLATMAPNPHLINVPTMVGGQGPQGVRTFYSKRLIGQFFPPDVTIETISRTYSEERLVDELIISFTHTIKMDHMLPGVEPTGKSLASKATRSPTSTSCGTRRVFLSSLASSTQRVFQSSAQAPPRS